MRWLVEVTALGKTDTESLHIESESWQKALQAARAQRGETSPLSGFSIEVLEDGARALDPLARLRYAVSPAPEGAPAARPADRPSSTAVAPPRPSVMVGADRSATDHTPRESVPAAAQLPLTEAAVGAVGKIVFKREQDATDDMPLTYREYAYLVPPGTSEAAAERLLLAQLGRVRSSLERSPPGKLVNMGVFDGVVQGRPRLPPLATLCWKDWRVDPALVFPRQQTTRPPLVVVAAQGAQVGGLVAREGRASEVSVAPVPMGSRPSSPPESDEPPLHAGPSSVGGAAVDGLVPEPAVASVEPQVPRAATGTGPFPSAVSPPVTDKGPAPVAANGLPVLVAPTQPTASPPAPIPTTPPGASATPPLTRPPIAFPAPTAATRPLSSTAPAARAAATISIRPRVRAEDLITDLFEVMHDLHFLRDAVEGGYFCLDQAMDKVPSRAGLVHLYDIDRRTFLVTSARGPDARALLLRRHPENDPILSTAMRKRRAVLMTEALRGDTTLPNRYAELGGAQSLVVAPVMQSGRFLGAIELVNPLDGQPFTESEANALTYIADQFAEFVATRGVVTDPERINVIR